MRKYIASLAAAALMAVGFAGPAAATPQVGLINLDVTVITGDILSDNVVTVQVPVTAAANICGVQVSAILALNTQDVQCIARSGTATAQN